MSNKISLEYALNNYSNYIKYPNELKRIYTRKSLFPENILIPKETNITTLQLLPLYQIKEHIEKIIKTTNKDKFSNEDKGKIQQLYNLYETKKNQYQNLPEITIHNSKEMSKIASLVKRLQRLNLECETFQKVKRGNLCADIGLGGTFYLLQKENKEIKAYSKLVPLSINGQMLISLDSIETYDAGIQTLNDWEKNQMLDTVYAMYASTIEFGKLFEFDGIITRSPESVEFSQDLGIRQVKYGKKGDMINAKIGVDITKNKHQNKLYRDIGNKARTITRKCYMNSPLYLEEEISNLKTSNLRLNEIHTSYINICQKILHKLKNRNHDSNQQQN